jgi:hypothetical protein
MGEVMFVRGLGFNLISVPGPTRLGARIPSQASWVITARLLSTPYSLKQRPTHRLVSRWSAVDQIS